MHKQSNKRRDFIKQTALLTASYFTSKIPGISSPFITGKQLNQILPFDKKLILNGLNLYTKEEQLQLI